MVELKQSQEFVCQKHDEFKAEYDRIRKAKNNNDAKISELKVRTLANENAVNLELEKLDNLEQYGRRNNLEIEGVPPNSNENVDEIVVEVAKLIGVEIKQDDISVAHRLPEKNKVHNSDSRSVRTKPPTIIARFVGRGTRNAIYKRRSAARNVKDFSIANARSVYVDENLTQRKKLFWLTRQAALEKKYKFYWTNNGNILIRKDEESRVTFNRKAILVNCNM